MQTVPLLASKGNARHQMFVTVIQVGEYFAKQNFFVETTLGPQFFVHSLSVIKV